MTSSQIIWRNRIIWTLLLGGIAVLWYSTVQHQLNSELSKVSIAIEKIEGSKSLVSKKDIIRDFKRIVGENWDELQIKELDLVSLELELEKDSRVLNAEVFLDAQNKLYIQIEQREPIMRIISDSGENYYIDNNGDKIQPIKSVAARVPIVTGHVMKYRSDWMSQPKHNLNDLYSLISSSSKDDFLRALFEQIHVDEGGQLTIIPKFGGEKLFFGDIRFLDEKLENIKIAYSRLLKTEGYGKYAVLKMDIPNQIVPSQEPDSSE